VDVICSSLRLTPPFSSFSYDRITADLFHRRDSPAGIRPWRPSPFRSLDHRRSSNPSNVWLGILTFFLPPPPFFYLLVFRPFNLLRPSRNALVYRNTHLVVPRCTPFLFLLKACSYLLIPGFISSLSWLAPGWFAHLVLSKPLVVYLGF